MSDLNNNNNKDKDSLKSDSDSSISDINSVNDKNDEKENKNSSPKEIEEKEENNQSKYSSSDYYNSEDESYKNALNLPDIEVPKKKENKKFSDTKKKQNFSNKITFKENTEKNIISIENNEENEKFLLPDAEDIIEYYQITKSYIFDYSSNIYDSFSKPHQREILKYYINLIDIDKNYFSIEEAKKKTNAYEDCYENYFKKHSAYKLANLNYIFHKELIKKDLLVDYTSFFIVGDNGGFTDYIRWYTHEKLEISSNIFVIPDKNNEVSKNENLRKIFPKENIENNIFILNEFLQKNKNIDEYTNLNSDFLKKISDYIKDKTENGINLYIAKKFVKHTTKENEELKYKLFFLINIILSLSTLNKTGNFIIKLYDSFTPFTICLIFLLYNSFQKITIVKPFSTRPYSASRFLVAENFFNDSNKILEYLYNFFDKYVELLKQGKDTNIVIKTGEITKNSYFINRIFEINSQITEYRIEALKEINKSLNDENIQMYDKMLLKKECLDNWEIPIINYDENLLAKNLIKNNKPYYNYGNKKNYHKTEIMNSEDAKDIGNFDEGTNKLLDILIKKDNNNNNETNIKKIENKKKEFIKEDKSKKVEEILFGNKHNKKKKKKNEKHNDNKKKHKFDEENKKFLNEKRYREEMEENYYTNRYDNNLQKEKESKKKIIDNEEKYKEIKKNKEEILNKLDEVPDSIKEKLLKFKK